MESLVNAGLRPMLITFDGMHEDADLAFLGANCPVLRVSSLAPKWLRWLFGKLTGIESGTTAAPSRVKRPFQIYLYNQFATAISVLYACRAGRGGPPAVLHLLCPPSWLTLRCFQVLRRRGTRAAITAFVGPKDFGGSPALRKRFCREKTVTIVVQTEALAAEWAREVGPAAIRLIPLPSGGSVCRSDRKESRRLLDLPDDKPIVAVIGCITPGKGYIELFEALEGTRKHFRVLLIGDTPAWICPDPEKIVQKAGWLDHTILRREFVPESRMPSLFAAIDAVALLYRKPEGSSGILSLCRQFGVPVIATSFGEIGSLVRSEQLGVTVNPADREAVSNGITTVLARKGGQTSISTTVETGAQSWAGMGMAHALLYEDLRTIEGAQGRADDDTAEPRRRNPASKI